MGNNTGSSVVVTGANGGVGSAIATTLAEAGFRVWGLDIDEKPKVNCIYKYLKVDFRNSTSIEQAIRSLDLEGGHENWYALINNAGIYRGLSFSETSISDFDDIYSVNVKAPFFLSKWFALRVESQSSDGVVVNVGSISGRFGSQDVAYGVSKGAVGNLTKSLSLALSPNIRVNEVSPGVINTDMARNIPKDRLKEYETRTSLGTIGEPIDVANTVSFLLDSKARHIAGASIAVDGGYH